MVGLESSRWSTTTRSSSSVPTATTTTTTTTTKTTSASSPSHSAAAAAAAAAPVAPVIITTTTTTASTATTANATKPSSQPLSSSPSPPSTVTPAPGPAPKPASATSRADELERHRRLLRRMRWKLPYLADSHRRATAPAPELSAVEVREAELMFKLDFFEYYVLLERALLHLLAVFGITVSGRNNNGNASSNGTLTPNSSAAVYSHRFHANVLVAFDQPSNPLHTILGVGDVRKHLAAAKELRNRWKDADEHALLAVDNEAPETASPPPLSAYEIEQMLSSIFDAFDKAQDVADKAVKDATLTNRGNGQKKKSWADVMEMDDDMPWESVPDAMDWEGLRNKH